MNKRFHQIIRYQLITITREQNVGIIFIYYFSYCAIFFVLAFLVTYKIPFKDVKYEEFLETIKKSGRKVELVNTEQ